MKNQASLTFIPARIFHKDGQIKILLKTINHIYEFQYVENGLRGPLRVTCSSSANKYLHCASECGGNGEH